MLLTRTYLNQILQRVAIGRASRPIFRSAQVRASRGPPFLKTLIFELSTVSGGRDRDRTGYLLVANQEKNPIRRVAATTYAFAPTTQLGNWGNPDL